MWSVNLFDGKITARWHKLPSPQHLLTRGMPRFSQLPWGESIPAGFYKKAAAFVLRAVAKHSPPLAKACWPGTGLTFTPQELFFFQCFSSNNTQLIELLKVFWASHCPQMPFGHIIGSYIRVTRGGGGFGCNGVLGALLGGAKMKMGSCNMGFLPKRNSPFFPSFF